MPNYANFFTGTNGKAPAPETAPASYGLLLVDDEPNILKALRRVFREENYNVLMAANGDEALRLLKENPVQVVISDHMMPGMTGTELLKQIKTLYPDTIRIMLTGHADTSAVMGAINEGAVYKFIVKPWSDDDLRVTVALALEQHDLVQRNRSLVKDNQRQHKQITQLSKMAVTNRSQLAIMLHKRQLLNERQVQELHKLQQTRKTPMLKLILERKWVDENTIQGILRKDLYMEEVALPEFQVDPAVTDLVSRSFCETNWVMPLKLDGKRLLLAVADPMDSGLLDDLRFSSGLELEPVMAPSSAIQAKIEEVYPASDLLAFDELETGITNLDAFESIEVVIEDDDDISLDELLRQTEEMPAVRLVNAVILEAVRLKASDIHVQPRAKAVMVRYRIDGVLVDKIQIPHHMYGPMVSRIKVMAELDISERRRPQDGRITVKTPMRIIDLRISMLPTLNGEKVVMRILDRNATVQHLDRLGFSQGDLDTILDLVAKPQGIVLATGPTGSGKTTTLYALLHHNASSSKNYLTIEDPVEFYLDLAGQVHIREKIGLTFPSVLRAILRQDPDVILLGEIRDLETAEVAFHAALTGHMVYSTLHTNSAVASIARLFDLGLKPYIIASSLEGIIAQRLVRRVCDHCRDEVAVDAAVRERLGPLFQTAEFDSGAVGQGCHHCGGSGYSGRIGIYEVLVPDDELRHLVSSAASVLEIKRYADETQERTMLHDAARKAAAGITNLEEVLRVLGPQTRSGKRARTTE